jgi:hypothetical protein
MHIVRLLIAAILAATVSALADHASAQERWSALDPDSNARAYFGWGNTKDEANSAALKACRRVSKTCAEPPGSTPDLNNTFAMMCCTNPRFACAVFPETTREEAHKKVTGLFVNAHFSNCAIKGYYSARTGKRM